MKMIMNDQMSNDELLKFMDSIEFNIQRTINKLQRKVKWRIGMRFWNKPTEHQQQIINDILFMPFDLMDYLLLEKYKSIDEYIECINTWLQFEQQTFEYNYPLKYIVGHMKILLNDIDLHHQYIELKTKIGLN